MPTNVDDESKVPLILEGDPDEFGEEVHEERTTTKSIWSSPLLFCVAILCTVLNLLLFRNSLNPTSTTVLEFEDMARLPRPNQFIGLENIQRVQGDPIVVYPNMLSIINRKEPDRAYGEDPQDLTNWTAHVPPDKRLFKVTSEISTIIEFQTLDYEFEDCELMLSVPPHSESSTPISISSNYVEIWALDSPYRLYMPSLTWNHRPTRKELIDVVPVGSGHQYSYRFTCLLNSIHTFEFVAANDTTFLEWYQGRASPNPSVLLKQHSTSGMNK